MIISVDVGGTFTDIVLADPERGLTISKVVSRPDDYTADIVNAVETVLRKAQVSPEQITRVALGTTVGLNAVIEHRGAITAVLATKGFEDVLEIGRQKRPRLYDLFIDTPTPVFIAPRHRRRGIVERISATGEELVALDEEQVRRTVRDLVDNEHVEAIAVCCLFSFLNPSHEQRIREIVNEEYPGLAVSISSDVDPVFREYERLCVTALDAYLKPVMQRHVEQVNAGLRDAGLRVDLDIMQSRGGIAGFRSIVHTPARTLVSGPAGGVRGAHWVASRVGHPNIISLDVGGTSADIAVVRNSRIPTTTEGKIADYPVRLPMIDCSSIGAGGGSIAWLDPTNGLHVGPQSAGAQPGPVAYGRGGTEPTVTDASLVLGWLDASNFGDGQVPIDVEASHRALDTLGASLGLPAEEVAWAIHAITNANMAEEIRLWTVNRGYDPREFALVVAGGGGAVHGGLVARLLSIQTVIVPPTPGVLSALGILVANIEHDNALSFNRTAADTAPDDLRAAYDHLDELGSRQLAEERVAADQVRITRTADLRYVGQSYELNVDLRGPIDGSTVGQLVEDFHARHRQVYGQAAEDAPTEIVSVRTVHWSPLPKPATSPHEGTGSWDEALKHHRIARFYPEYPDGVRTPVFDRLKAPVDVALYGPAIIDQLDTTTVVYPGFLARVHPDGTIIMTAETPGVPVRNLLDETQKELVR
ncbi:hydantoinase/oxoprolinase family protein [Brooklawnia cerclae]|uniref:N-methylhydantoinase A n=1 Tax=Brooklawnia cerclae TaxID=349934 RepID=A0ABX0SPK5_9ACTN|nr:hydantoinase/oxoprolinase family protein [Brooklawnia cerclae]NIH58686.1 N-methylhydantoinase A [Brooklawnia cerclae]